MKFITYAENKEQLTKISDLVKNQKIKSEDLEVIVSAELLSRYGMTGESELLELISLNQSFKLPLVLEWDVLKQESLFKKNIEFLKTLPLHEFKSIRVQDPGALNYILENYSWLKIQLILENGNHNFSGLMRWKELIGNQLERLVLSNELSRDHLTKYAKDLGIDIEVMAFGRILLFYTPRQLLSPLSKKEREEKIIQDFEKSRTEAFGTSEESPHTGFPLVENIHGTFMFNVKDLFLLDHLEEIKSIGVSAVRFDLRFDGTFSYLEKIADLFYGRISAEECSEIKSNHPRPMIKGFYNINKTDVLFTKLKNRRIQRQDDNYVGEIVDVERDKQLALTIKSKTLSLKAGAELQVITPEGKEKTITIKNLLDTNHHEIESATTNDIVLLPYMSGIVAKSQVYLRT